MLNLMPVSREFCRMMGIDVPGNGDPYVILHEIHASAEYEAFQEMRRFVIRVIHSLGYLVRFVSLDGSCTNVDVALRGIRKYVFLGTLEDIACMSGDELHLLILSKFES